MKKKIIMELAFCTLLALITSCDSKKDETERTAKEFAEAINDKDLSVITQLYPRMVDMQVSHLGDSINYEKIVVTKSDSIYVAEYQPGSQKLYIQYHGNTPVIIDSKGIMMLNEVPLKLAKSTGVPIKKMTDYEVEGMLNTSKFIAYLLDAIINSETVENLSVEDIRWIWGNTRGVKSCRIRTTITNNMDHRVNGDDYIVEVKAYYGKNYSQSGTYRLSGVDLLPNESYTYETYEPYLYRYANNDNLKVDADVVPKDKSSAGLLMFIADYNGTEFNDFIKKNPDVNIENPKTYILVPQEKEDSE